jgi:glycosyltransferase involved in cell wall biosynthesis
LGSPTYIVSSASPPQIIRDGIFVIEHRPKRSYQGYGYHLSQIFYGLGLFATAVKFGADYAIVHSGTTHYFALSVFRLAGIKVIPIIHNTLWPAGFPPRSLASRVLLFLDGLFFRRFASATVALSPECIRQIDKVTNGKHGLIYEENAWFVEKLFPLTPPPPVATFRLLFAGRIEQNKGVFDLLEIMKRVEQQMPDRVTLDICGDGPELETLRTRCKNLGLDSVITIHGRMMPADLRNMLTSSHASIVPTRSNFPEGLAYTAIEPILIGRPVITNPVVPAHEIIGNACLVAETDNVESYVQKILLLLRDPDLYQSLCNACASIRGRFFDQSKSLYTILKRTHSHLGGSV